MMVAAFLIRCDKCNTTIEREDLHAAKIAVKIHQLNVKHQPLIYGLAVGLNEITQEELSHV